MAKPILQVQNLSVAFGQGAHRTLAIDSLSFDLHHNQCLGLVGESGSGKSMSALAIMQLLPFAARVSQDSRILLAQQELLSTPERRMRFVRGARIGMIFQDAMSAFNPVLTTGYQIVELLRLHKKISRKAARAITLNLFEEVGISDPAQTFRSYPHELSGGMRQRAMIAMTLSVEPEILIADEPTTALDVTIQAQVLELLKTLKQKHQKTLLFISHDLAVVSQLSDEIIVLKNGQKVEQESAKIFFSHPKHEYSRKLLAAIPTKQRATPISDSAPTLLQVNNLSVYFPIRSSVLRRVVSYTKAVDGVDFNLRQGETMAIVGESGSGKTTTGKAILKLIEKTSGNMLFENEDLDRLSHKLTRQLRRDMQIIFQDPYASLDPRMLIADSISEGMLAQKIVRGRKQALQRVDELLTQVDLPLDSKWRYPHEFSGGQRQRICIARALALKPRLLVLDEPTSALDVSIQMQILTLLKELQSRLKLSYLLITHNLSVVGFMAHRVAVMHQGKIVEKGSTDQVLHDPQHAYTQRLLASVPTINLHNEEITHEHC